MYGDENASQEMLDKAFNAEFNALVKRLDAFLIASINDRLSWADDKDEI